MHELGIAQNIIEIVQDQTKNYSNRKIKNVFVKVGKLTNVLNDSLVFGYDALIMGTNLEGSKLSIETVPAKIRCESCGSESVIDGLIFCCDQCKSTSVKLVTGMELTVFEIEIEDLSEVT